MGDLQPYSFLDNHFNKVFLAYFNIFIRTNPSCRWNNKLLILLHETFAELFRQKLQWMSSLPHLSVKYTKHTQLQLRHVTVDYVRVSLWKMIVNDMLTLPSNPDWRQLLQFLFLFYNYDIGWQVSFGKRHIIFGWSCNLLDLSFFLKRPVLIVWVVGLAMNWKA